MDGEPPMKWRDCPDRFWEQIARLAPGPYIADGTVLKFASRNAGLFTKVHSALSAIAGSAGPSATALFAA